jgi:hypothetical protein
MTDESERVCARCGEPAGEANFCSSCGLNLAELLEIPTRAEWEVSNAARGHCAGGAEPPQRTSDPSGVSLDSTLPCLRSRGRFGVCPAGRFWPCFRLRLASWGLWMRQG